MNSKKPRILIIGGINETVIHPIPPVADGAPEWNVFRLSELESDLDIQVVSPCQMDQVEKVKKQFSTRGNYHHIVFPTHQLWLYRKVLRHSLLLRLVVRRLAKVTDLMSWWYLIQVKKILRAIAPDLVFINGYPQFIRYLRPLVPAGRLWLFMRHQIGESRRYLPYLNGIIVNSHAMHDYAAQFVDQSLVPIHQMPNALGDEFIVPPHRPQKGNDVQKRIIFAGRFIPEKGVLELVKAFQLVCNDYPGCQLIIYGSSGDQSTSNKSQSPYEQEVRSYAKGIQTGRVNFGGYLSNREMGSRYIQNDLAVFPSIIFESFGMVALEAMRCHLPVVASRRPGFEELVLPGETGLLVDDPKDIQSLAQAILTILRDPRLAHQMGEAGYIRSLNYTPAIALRKLEDILEPILM